MPVVRSTLDVAFWFAAAAQEFRVRLQPMKLQYLLYLSQARYAAANEGAALMPATFIVTPEGPIEPNIYYLFESGPPRFEAEPPQAQVEDHFRQIWNRFGKRTAAELAAIVKADQAFCHAADDGDGTVIEFPKTGPEKPAKARREVSGIVGMVTASGQPVRRWVPGEGRAAAKAGKKREAAQERPKDHPASAAAHIPPKVMGTTLDGRTVTKWVPGMKKEDLAVS